MKKKFHDNLCECFNTSVCSTVLANCIAINNIQHILVGWLMSKVQATRRACKQRLILHFGWLLSKNANIKTG